MGGGAIISEFVINFIKQYDFLNSFCGNKPLNERQVYSLLISLNPIKTLISTKPIPTISLTNTRDVTIKIVLRLL